MSSRVDGSRAAPSRILQPDAQTLRRRPRPALRKSKRRRPPAAARSGSGGADHQRVLLTSRRCHPTAGLAIAAVAVQPGIEVTVPRRHDDAHTQAAVCRVLLPRRRPSRWCLVATCDVAKRRTGSVAPRRHRSLAASATESGDGCRLARLTALPLIVSLVIGPDWVSSPWSSAMEMTAAPFMRPQCPRPRHDCHRQQQQPQRRRHR